MNILVCTDGSPTSTQSALLISKLAFPKDTQITLLGVSENPADAEKLNASMDLIEQIFAGNYLVKRKIRSGYPMEEILSEAILASYELVALGGGSRQMGLLQPQLGSTTSQLARKLHTHFLVARNVPQTVLKILVCAGKEATPSKTMNFGGVSISNTKAQVHLLHVLPTRLGVGELKERKINLASLEQETGDLSSANSVITQASQQLRAAGVKSHIETHIRRGLVVEEVLDELSTGKYDLLIVGAHYQPGQDRWRGTLFDDITDQLLNHCTCSMLII